MDIRKTKRRASSAAFWVFLAGAGNLAAQSNALALPGQVFRDEVRFAAAPAHMRKKTFVWLAPFAGATAFLLATDQRNMNERIHTDPAARNRSDTVSNLSLGSLAVLPPFLIWQGWRNGAEYEEQTGWMAVRAVADTLVASEAIGLIARRDRPAQSGSAPFFAAAPGRSAFPSDHAATAWALASVLAHRYPGWFTDVLAYGLAGTVSMTRVIGREHSPSDAFVGSALGFLIGKYVAGTGSPRPVWNRLADSITRERPSAETAAPSRGAEYVPLSSWIYGALDRLSALGLIPSQTADLRPWTYAECKRQVMEAESLLAAARTAQGEQEAALVDAVRKELERARGGLVLDSLYTINGEIAGPVLNDSFHFGQTWYNDSGRPFGRGWNSDTGFTAHAESGRFFVYVNGEYQHAPGFPAYSEPVRQAIAGLDGNPLQPAFASSATNRFRLLDTYAGLQIGDLELSVGKQTLWWGPSMDSPFSFGANAEPTKNFRASTAHPLRLPDLGGHTVEVRGEFVMGKLGGQAYTWRPWFNGQKISFKLTDNLEMGFTRWSILWGVGHPVTAGSFVENFTSTNSPRGAAGTGRNDPGDRKGGFDFRYRLPGLRNWLTVYSDSYSDDDPSPLANPSRSAINPGLYLARIPGLPKLDFRVEAPSTTPLEGDMGGTFIYYNGQYHSGNTNYGTLLGNSVGRDGRAQEGWLSYWLSPRSRLQGGYRQLKIGSDFLPGGGTQSDASLHWSGPLGATWRADASVQYERFWIPLLGGPGRNISARLQITQETNLQILKRIN